LQPAKKDNVDLQLRACSLVGAGAGLDWLVLVFCERKTLLAGWFELAETNKRTGCKNIMLSCRREVSNFQT